MPTLRDVAAEAGVTKMTVSNVLNGRRDQVSEATYERVMSAVQRLGYVRNATARSLSAKRSGIVAMVYRAPPAGADPLGNPHDSTFIGEVERSVSGAGRHLMLRSAESPIAAVDNLRSWNVDAAIFLNTVAEDIETVRARHNVPLVFVDNYSGSPLISNVGIDDYRGGYLAAERLAEAGHRRIAWVGPGRVRNEVMDQRFRGFADALARRGIPVDAASVVECELTFGAAVEVGESLADRTRSLTAVFAPADIIAIGLLKGLHHKGVDVPAQVSVVGFDDLPVSYQVSPELTTIRQDIRAKARTAVDLALRLLDAGPDAQPEHIALDVTLVERESVASPRSDGPDPGSAAAAAGGGGSGALL